LAKDSGARNFQQAVIILCLRPDWTIFASSKDIAESLGSEFIGFSLVSLDAIAVESANASLVIFLLSSRSDPTPLVEEAGRRAKKELHTVSIGQGREEFAENFITQSKHGGDWVQLQNCHFGLRCMEMLFEMWKADGLAGLQTMKEADGEKEKEDPGEKLSEDTKAAKGPLVSSEDYRLWIRTEVHPRFPISLLQLSIKLTNEPQAGAKASMKRTMKRGAASLVRGCVLQHDGAGAPQVRSARMGDPVGVQPFGLHGVG
jgi:dynein heavy chain